ncbi:MAG: arginine--tRNA ligase [Planctomycetota bacterium]|nr:MAG: arginine--tRNA ligase [Planctomycetota bacterium]
MQLLSLLADRFEEALRGWVEHPEEHARRVAVARDPRHGDYQANIAMPLAKPLGQPPRQIAEQIVQRLQVDDICMPPEIAGPGFINLKVRDAFLAESIQRMAQDDRLLVGNQTPRRYVIDYSAPNVAKPMHVGHIRSTVIGDSLCRVLRFLGHEVVSDNHLGDWGTQFGMIIYGYKHFVDPAAFEQNPVAELSRIYRMVQSIIAFQSAQKKLPAAERRLERAARAAQEAETAAQDDPQVRKASKQAAKELRAAREEVQALQDKVQAVLSDPELARLAEAHPDLEKRVQLETVKLHQGDEENLGLWRQFMPISIREIESVYRRLGVHFDHTLGESFYHPMLPQIVQKLVDSGIAVESDGAICVFLEGFDAPMIIRKRDGAFLYATTDLATVEYRMQHFHPDAILYVVDHRQSEHFQKLFAAVRKMGYADVELQHVAFGTVLGPDGRPFKTRSGSVVGLEYLLDEAVERAYQVVCDAERLERAGLELSESQRREIAEVVGIGAIKYADLSHNRTSDYEFNIDQMVQLEGNTSTYIQYMYARTCSILRKSGETIDADWIAQTTVVLPTEVERTMALQLLQLEDALLQTAQDYMPSVLASYLYALAKQYAVFFDQCPVLTAEDAELRASRLLLCHVVGRVLRQGLDLLGINVVERM